MAGRVTADDPADLGVLEASALLRSRRLSAAELLGAVRARIEARNGGPPSFDGRPDAINAWIRLYPELAEQLARDADERLGREGEAAPPLCGIPLALKDLYGVAGLPVTASSAVLEGNVAAEDCVAWARLRARGMVLVGHTHTHEFGAGGSTDQVGNPWALDRTAGGSSGGSAAALASGMVPAALGTDTLGSLRIPSAICGTSAIKATHGRVPIGGIVPLASSLDHSGPMARTVADCAALLSALAEDGPDSSPLMPPPAGLGELPFEARPGPRPLEGLRIALTDRPEHDGLDPDVADGLERARVACERLGASVVEHHPPAQLPAEELDEILLSEMWALHGGFADRADRYRPRIREMVAAAGTATDAQAYIRAMGRAAAFTAEWERWFAEHGTDLLLEPTVPVVAHPRGAGYDPGLLGADDDPMAARRRSTMGRSPRSRLTSTWNLTGFPVAAIPAGVGTRSGLPVGVSLVAPGGAEAVVTTAAIDLQEHELPPERPPL
jgi:aspartyl-tRNA(Asn)/glutamyl-tRNA(Gln) amidotransferase subunit A